MNSPNHRDYKANQPLQYSEEPFEDHPRFAPDAPPLRADEYDPVWISQNEAAQSGLAPSEPAPYENVEEDTVSQRDLDRLEQIIASEQFRIRRRHAPAFMPPPPPPVAQRRPGIRWAVGTFAVLLVSSSIIALQVTDRMPFFDATSSEGGSQLTRLASLVTSERQQDAATDQTAPTEAAKLQQRSKPRLVVNGASADSPDQILLGVAVEGSADGVNAVVSGLAPGTMLTAGKAWGATGWIVPAADVATTYLRPPAGFSGTMEYSVALQLPDNSVLERQTMRLEWAAPNAEQAAAQQPQSPPAAPQSPTARSLEASELALLVKRGEDLLREGDVASARLLLQRAAEAEDARAAFALAATYDPVELKRIGAYGAAPDVAKARDWYQKAKQYGSREAPRRLELLASQYR